MFNSDIYNSVLDIFYNEVILECSSNGPKIGDDFPTVYFDVKLPNSKINDSSIINPKPILVINDKNTFDKALYYYVIKAIEFYYDGKFLHDNIKYILVFAFTNATSDDLNNPVIYLNKRTLLFDNDLELKKDINFLGYDGVLESKKEKPFLEAPYSFRLTIFDEEHSYALPYIMYGIKEDTAYVYAIQNKFKESNPLRKKINRLLFKLDKEFVDEHDSTIFNATDVSMPFVAVLISFISYLNEMGIDKIKVPVNLPIRYNSHYKSYERRIAYYEKSYSKDDFLNKKKELEKLNSAFDDNTIMKLVRTFYRVSKQGDVLKINTYPFMQTSELSLSVNKDGEFNNELCNQIYHFNEKSK